MACTFCPEALELKRKDKIKFTIEERTWKNRRILRAMENEDSITPNIRNRINQIASR